MAKNESAKLRGLSGYRGFVGRVGSWVQNGRGSVGSWVRIFFYVVRGHISLRGFVGPILFTWAQFFFFAWVNFFFTWV